jgi:hypothetical protein
MKRKQVPDADAILIARCGDPECRHVHMMLVDGDQRHLASVSLNRGQVEAIAEAGGFALVPRQERRAH